MCWNADTTFIRGEAEKSGVGHETSRLSTVPTTPLSPDQCRHIKH